MLWSKIVFFLAALFAGAAALLLVAQPLQAQREIDNQIDGHLQGASRGAGLLIKIHARKWLDAAAQVSIDAHLVEYLEQATKASGGNDLQHSSAQARLRDFNAEWKTDLIIAVDGKGRVLARAGLDEQLWKDDLSGYPLVSEALRGYRLDDTWDLNGKLYRVSASPVIARDKYVGCLLVANEIGTELANRIRDTLGVEVAFLVRGEITGQSAAMPVVPELSRILKTRAAELADRGSTDPVPIVSGDRAYALVAAPIAGEASAHDAAFVLVTERPVIGSLHSTLLALSPATLNWRKAAPTVAFGLALLILGFVLLSVEHDRPAKKLHAAMKQLSRGEIPTINDTEHPGIFGRIARAANALLDRIGRPKEQRSIDDILGPESAARPRTPHNRSTSGRMAAINVPSTPSFNSPSGRHAPITAPPRTPSFNSPSGRHAPIMAPPSTPSFNSPSGRHAPIMAPPSTPSFNSPSGRHAPIMPPPSTPSFNTPSGRHAPIMPPPPTPSARPPSNRMPAVTPPSAYNNPPAARTPTVPPSKTPSKPPAPPSAHVIDSSTRLADSRALVSEADMMPPAAAAGGHVRDEFDDPPTREVPPDEVQSFAQSESTSITEAPAGILDSEREFQSVYEEFVSTKKQCGEPVDGVTFDRFVVKLRQNRDQLMARFSCKSVKFQVYVKDGKAALKATPVTR